MILHNKGNTKILDEIKEIALAELTTKQCKFLEEVEKLIKLNGGSDIQAAVVYFMPLIKESKLNIDQVYSHFGDDTAGLVFNSSLIINQDDTEVILTEVGLNSIETKLIASAWHYASMDAGIITGKQFIEKLIDLYGQNKITYDFSKAMQEFI